MALGWGVVTTPLPLTGDQIRRAREALRMTQQELADELGVGLRTIGRWERGESAPRSAMGALTRALQLPTPGDTTAHPDRDDAGPRLHEASHVELLAEIGRRIAASQDPGRDLPPVPQDRLTFPRSAAPSARRKTDNPDAESNSSS